MTITIRRASHDDVPVMQALEHDAAQAFRAVGYDFCANGPVRTLEEHERGLTQGVTFVAEIGGDTVGFIMMWPVDGHGHITEVSVAERFQQRGIGRALIKAVEDWVREQGFSSVTLTTFRDIPWNAPFYSSLGYEAFSPGEDEHDLLAIQAEEAGSGYAAQSRITMRKVL